MSPWPEPFGLQAPCRAAGVRPHGDTVETEVSCPWVTAATIDTVGKEVSHAQVSSGFVLSGSPAS